MDAPFPSGRPAWGRRESKYVREFRIAEAKRKAEEELEAHALELMKAVMDEEHERAVERACFDANVRAAERRARDAKAT